MSTAEKELTERRERIATAILAALISGPGRAEAPMFKAAVDAAEKLICELDSRPLAV